MDKNETSVNVGGTENRAMPLDEARRRYTIESGACGHGEAYGGPVSPPGTNEWVTLLTNDTPQSIYLSDESPYRDLTVFVAHPGQESERVEIGVVRDLPALAADAERWRFCARERIVPMPFWESGRHAWSLGWDNVTRHNTALLLLVASDAPWSTPESAIDAARAVVEPSTPDPDPTIEASRESLGMPPKS